MPTCPKGAVQVGRKSVRLLPGEDMTVQHPSDPFSGVSSGVLDNNLKETIVHSG